MRDVVVLAEVVAFVGVMPGFVALAVVTLARGPMYRLDRDIQRLPPDRFREVIMMPVISVVAGSIAGIGVNLATGETNNGWVAILVIGAAIICVGWAGRMALRPAGPRFASTAYRRQLLARLGTRRWAAAPATERAAAARVARRLERAGARLASRGDSLGFRPWLRSRNRWVVGWLAVATAYGAAVLIWVAVDRIVNRDASPPGWGAAVIVATPLLGPAQLWLWWRLHRAMLRDLGAELRADAAGVLSAVTSAPPLTVGRRLGRALRVLLDSGRSGR
jgi:hypothetical protein